MPATTLRQLLEAGVHFGHQTSRWNPKMKPYIFTARNGIHIIDLEQTQVLLDEAREAVRALVAGGQKILFVGTKKQAQDSIREACDRTGQYYVVHRWMGGMLTNFPVIQRRLKTLVEERTMFEQGDFERMSGKEANAHRDDLERLERNFSGMVEMKRLPGALFIVDCKKERLAVMEANKLGIPIIAITDTNCDPQTVRHVIPGNDDAIRAIKLIIGVLTDAIVEGQQQLGEREERELRQKAEEADRALKEQAASEDAGEEPDDLDGAAGVSEHEFVMAKQAAAAETTAAGRPPAPAGA